MDTTVIEPTRTDEDYLKDSIGPVGDKLDLITQLADNPDLPVEKLRTAIKLAVKACRVKEAAYQELLQKKIPELVNLAFETSKQIVEDEEEFPGDPPEGMVEDLLKDPVATLRIVVKCTKESITTRLEESRQHCQEELVKSAQRAIDFE